MKNESFHLLFLSDLKQFFRLVKSPDDLGTLDESLIRGQLSEGTEGSHCIMTWSLVIPHSCHGDQLGHQIDVGRIFFHELVLADKFVDPGNHLEKWLFGIRDLDIVNFPKVINVGDKDAFALEGRHGAQGEVNLLDLKRPVVSIPGDNCSTSIKSQKFLLRTEEIKEIFLQVATLQDSGADIQLEE